MNLAKHSILRLIGLGVIFWNDPFSSSQCYTKNHKQHYSRRYTTYQP
jgi:hypothetical protein